MSTKTIAVDVEVYARLARLKGESQSFSRLIDSLIDRVVTAHTADDVLAHLGEQPSLSDADADAMLRLVRENRESEIWAVQDLR